MAAAPALLPGTYTLQGVEFNALGVFLATIAGLAGLVLAVPLLFLGLSTSPMSNLNDLPANVQIQLEGNSLLYYSAKYLVFGQFRHFLFEVYNFILS